MSIRQSVYVTFLTFILSINLISSQENAASIDSNEIEEIIIGSNTLSQKDYIDCRVMDLFIQTFYNNYLFEEVFALLKSFSVSKFDCMLYIKENPELYSKNVKEIIISFTLSIIAARVVVLPQPVGPVTSTSPLSR